ncbi:MAG: TetR/AcrR family transcriptional regulator [Actinomycetota bacterium]
MSTNNTNSVPSEDANARRPGRPSVVDERRGQIVDAFIELIAERGDPNPTVADIAARAGVHRSAVRHFVGNKTALVAAAIDEIWWRYAQSYRDRVGPDDTIDDLVEHLFSDDYVWQHVRLDGVLSTLATATPHDEAATERIRAEYQGTLDAIVALLGNDEPAGVAAAYQLICLAEHNVTMQRLGFDPSFGQAALEAARRLIAPHRRISSSPAPHSARRR